MMTPPFFIHFLNIYNYIIHLGKFQDHFNSSATTQLLSDSSDVTRVTQMMTSQAFNFLGSQYLGYW